MQYRHRLVLAAFLPLLTIEAQSKCIPQPCLLVTFQTESCDFVTFDNKQELKEFYARHTPSTEVSESAVNTISGVRLKAKKQSSREVQCYSGADLMGDKSPKVRESNPNIYFYPTNDESVCSVFLKGETTKFVHHICCDTGPSSALCVVKDQLLSDVPEFLKNTKQKVSGSGAR